jgi:hypothetical protein
MYEGSKQLFRHKDILTGMPGKRIHKRQTKKDINQEGSQAGSWTGKKGDMRTGRQEHACRKENRETTSQTDRLQSSENERVNRQCGLPSSFFNRSFNNAGSSSS